MATYLHKNRNGNYYCRIPYPLNLKKLGFPPEVRFSLHTKNRKLAILLNLDVALYVKTLIGEYELAPLSDALQRKIIEKRSVLKEQIRNEEREIRKDEMFRDVMRQKWASESLVKDLQTNLDAARAESQQQRAISEKQLVEVDAKLELVKQLSQSVDSSNKPALTVTLAKLHEAFSQISKLDSIRPKSIQQKLSRSLSLVEFLGGETLISNINYEMVQQYKASFKGRIGSKTINEYITACRQMFQFAYKMNYVTKNLFADERVKPAKSEKSNKRFRWTSEQMTTLFNTECFTSHKFKYIEDFWIPIVILHTGARPAEICQLETNDYVVVDGIHCLMITGESDYEDNKKRLKTDYSERVVPIHSTLIKLGFIQYIQQRMADGQRQIFNCKPDQKDEDWSKAFTRRFAKVLDRIGLESKNRPTAYSFRHTVRDEYKLSEVSKDVVNEIFGHAPETFGERQYTHSNYKMDRVKEVLEDGINFESELTNVLPFAYVSGN
ncbi:tyrosine-type recombinase/integrase [Shewanella sp. HL-SH8]|uniref:tyrosine-type recombinase/integrase n=1 Tax=Shewanella sp. HL-SH8 TaxID=3436242 RepID=UPI003EB9FB7A